MGVEGCFFWICSKIMAWTGRRWQVGRSCRRDVDAAAEPAIHTWCLLRSCARARVCIFRVFFLMRTRARIRRRVGLYMHALIEVALSFVGLPQLFFDGGGRPTCS